MNNKEYKEAFISAFTKETSYENLLPELDEKFKKLISDRPKYLYRFRRFSEFSIDEIINQRIFLAKPDSFDDVMDSQYIIKKPKTIPSLKSDSDLAKEKYIEMLENMLARERNKYYHDVLRVACFTTKTDNIPLWYYYADRHRGICIEYDFSEFTSFAKEGVCLLPVIYPSENDEYEYRIFSRRDAASAISNALVKNEDWKFEKEWRLIRFCEDKKAVYFTAKISKIIVGYGATPQTILALINLIKKNDLKIKLALQTITPKGMSLIPVEL